MRQTRIDPHSVAQAADFRANSPAVGAHDLTSAMREERLCDAGLGAPAELGADGCVAEASAVATAHERTRGTCPVPDIEINALKRASAVNYVDDVGRVEEDGAAGRDPEADRGRAQGMDEGECAHMKARAPHRPIAQISPLPHGAPRQKSPSRRSGVDWTGRAVRKPRGMIGMGVREEDDIRCERLEPSGPILSAIEQRAARFRLDQKGAVAAMEAAPRLDVAARAEKGEPHDTKSSARVILSALIGRKAHERLRRKYYHNVVEGFSKRMARREGVAC